MTKFPMWILYLKNRINNILQIFHSRKNKQWEKYQRNSIYTQDEPIFGGVYDLRFNSQKRIFIIGTSTHENIGDSAIALAQIEFAKKHFPDYFVVEVPMYQYNQWLPVIKNYIKPDDML